MMMLLYIMTVDTIQPFGATQSSATMIMSSSTILLASLRNNIVILFLVLAAGLGSTAFNGGVTKYHASSRKFEASSQAVLLFPQSRPTDACSTTFRLQVEKKSKPIRLYCNPNEANDSSTNDSSTINSTQMQTQTTKSDNRAFRKKQDSMHHDDKNKWNEMFEKLKAYKREHGDCLVPQRYEKDKHLVSG